MVLALTICLRNLRRCVAFDGDASISPPECWGVWGTSATGTSTFHTTPVQRGALPAGSKVKILAAEYLAMCVVVELANNGGDEAYWYVPVLRYSYGRTLGMYIFR